MDKVQKPRGLIRYDSEKGIADRIRWHLSYRAMAYIGVLVLLVSGLSLGLVLRKPLQATVLRTAGLTWQDRGQGQVSNLYEITILNKTNNAMPIQLRLIQDGKIEWLSGDEHIVPAAGMKEESFFLIMNASTFYGRTNVPVELQLVSEGEIIQTIQTNFMTPLQSISKK